MYESNKNSFNFKPMTLYSFYPQNNHLKLSKKESSVSNNKKNTNITNNEKPKSNKKMKTLKWTIKNNAKYDYHYNFSPNIKPSNFNYLASSTSNNFYSSHNNNINTNNININNNNFLSRKYSMNHNSSNSNKKKGKFERIKSVGNTNVNLNNFENKEINEKYMEQYLDNYDIKLKRNKQNIKQSYTNNNNINNINTSNNNNYNNLYIKSNKRNIVKSSSKNKNKNYDYIDSIKYKNIIRLNSDKLYNYLPSLNFSKNKKSSPKTLKEILLNENYDINTINAVLNPNIKKEEIGKIRNYYNNANSLYKNNSNNNNIYNFNTQTKNNFFHVSVNPMLNSFNINNLNNKTNSNTDLSNFGNNNIIFNNYGSINNNIFIEMNRNNNTTGESNDINDKYKKLNSDKILFNTVKSEKKHNNINNNDIIIIKENTFDQNNNNNLQKEQEKALMNEMQNNENNNPKETKDLIINKKRAFSTVPYKSRKKTKKEIINIDCNKDKENINNINNSIEKNDNNNNNAKKDKLSKYEIGEVLGKGAYALVKLAKNKITKEKYAIKIYEKEKLNSNSKKSCVYKEIQILKKLNHKNIVKLIEVISTEKQILIVQELIEGISLREYYNDEIRNQKGISIHKENIFKKIFSQIFSAMDYVHKHGIAHRDIKLENILIKSNYEIKIIDFGFGMYNPEKKLQKFFCGTPNYMPPEIAEKKPYVGQLADMWSLGILVYKIFCADFPFKGKDEKELYKAIKNGKFSYAKYTPDYAKKIISGLIVLDPNKRMNCEDVLNSDWLKDK